MDLSDITTADPKLVVAFQKYTVRVRADENFSFWFDKGNNEGKYAKYIKKGAPKELTLDNSELVGKFNKLAAAGNFGSAMNPLFGEAREEVRKMLDGRMSDFAKSKEYKDYLTVKKAGNVTKALKLLGVTGTSAKTMEALLKEYALGSATQKQATLVKMQKIAKLEQIKLALKNSGLV